MAMPEKFTKKYAEVDASLRHGGIPGELQDQFVFPDLNDNWNTRNIDNLRIFRQINMSGVALSMSNVADIEGYPTRNLIEDCMRYMDAIIQVIAVATKATNTRSFEWKHASPAEDEYAVRAVRYPLRNPVAHDFVHAMIGSMIETAELNRNGYTASIDPQSAQTLMAPIYQFKSHLIKYYFDLEVSGEISLDELIKLSKSSIRNLAPKESSKRPSVDDVDTVMSGIDVLKFTPSREDWEVFSELQAMRPSFERILQPEGSRNTTEDVQPEDPLNEDGSLSVNRSQTTEQP